MAIQETKQQQILVKMGVKELLYTVGGNIK
jgi:hypothetical protein